MKWTTALLIMAMLLARNKAYTQITLAEKNAQLEKVLADIEKQTKYVFLYDPDELPMRTITVNIKNASLQKTLERCFQGMAIEFSVVGNNVLLRRKRSGTHQR